MSKTLKTSDGKKPNYKKCYREHKPKTEREQQLVAMGFYYALFLGLQVAFFWLIAISLSNSVSDYMGLPFVFVPLCTIFACHKSRRFHKFIIYFTISNWKSNKSD